MPNRGKKLEAIFNFGLMVGQNPYLAFLIGFLSGQVDRVNFVADLKDAEIAVKLSARQLGLWPQDPFKATVRGVSMPNPYTLVRSIISEPTPICVSLDFDHVDETPWYQDVVLPSVSYAKDADEAHHAESEALWKEIDHTLDVYRECRKLLNDQSPERRRELTFHMRTAEAEMKKLSREMEELNRQMKRDTEAE